MEQCYIKSNKLFFGAIMLFVIKDGKLCIFIDYHALNKITIKNNYPLPWIDDLFHHLHGVCYFNWVDLKPLLPNSHYECKCEKDDHEINMTLMDS
jgi:hypothetical protein